MSDGTAFTIHQQRLHDAMLIEDLSYSALCAAIADLKAKGSKLSGICKERHCHYLQGFVLERKRRDYSGDFAAYAAEWGRSQLRG